jgi:hypothetical protein
VDRNLISIIERSIVEVGSEAITLILDAVLSKRADQGIIDCRGALLDVRYVELLGHAPRVELPHSIEHLCETTNSQLHLSRAQLGGPFGGGWWGCSTGHGQFRISM